MFQFSKSVICCGVLALAAASDYPVHCALQIKKINRTKNHRVAESIALISVLLIWPATTLCAPKLRPDSAGWTATVKEVGGGGTSTNRDILHVFDSGEFGTTDGKCVTPNLIIINKVH